MRIKHTQILLRKKSVLPFGSTLHCGASADAAAANNKTETCPARAARATAFFSAFAVLLAPLFVFVALAFSGCDDSKSAAPVPTLKELHAANRLPTNFSLICEFEHFDEHGNIDLMENAEVVWDFEGKRARLFSFLHRPKDEGVAAILRMTKNEEDALIAFQFLKTKETSDFKSLFDKPFSEIPHIGKPTCHLKKSPFDAFAKLWYSHPAFSYDENKENSLFHLADNGKCTIQKTAEGIVLEHITGENARTVLTFDKGGHLVRKEKFKKFQITKKILLDLFKMKVFTERRIQLMEVKKNLKIGAYTLPVEMRTEDTYKAPDDTFHTKTAKIRIPADSIRLDKKYDDSFFVLKIPPGAEVYDYPKSLYYETDSRGAPIHSRPIASRL